MVQGEFKKILFDVFDMLLTFTDNFSYSQRNKNTVAVDNKNFDSLFFRVDFLSTNSTFHIKLVIGEYDNISG